MQARRPVNSDVGWLASPQLKSCEATFVTSGSCSSRFSPSWRSRACQSLTRSDQPDHCRTRFSKLSKPNKKQSNRFLIVAQRVNGPATTILRTGSLPKLRVDHLIATQSAKVRNLCGQTAKIARRIASNEGF